ncbi:metallophosphoesterase [Methanosarcina sp.]|uniref:metallophosphoesterase n=1 Tax=Methanosarcina sp. TaxID=2213 RepID=UPI003BB5815D
MAREIRILHTADTHLGYRQYHSEVRRQDFFKAFELVIDDAIEMQADAVVHAGDLFDSRNPTLEDLLETISILFRLKAAGIPLFGIVGNHESKQNTQWLDLFEEMGLAARLGKKPQMIGEGDAAIYGIDSVPKSKIPLFDYSGFEAPESSSSLSENCKKLLVMHQIVQPFPYADWDCAEVLDKLPFKIDAILLGDYHKYEKIKVGDAWVTYPGSTERNSTSEREPRSYNIITLSDEGVEISRRTIPTRDFLFISAKLAGDEKPYEQVFSAVDEHLEELPGAVVFLEISGDSGAVLSFSELEEYLLKKGVLVPRVRDLRIKESFPEDVLKVTFSDPDHAVANEIKRLSLNDGGLIVDEIVRNPNVSRSRVDEETEGRLSKLIEVIDFKDPDFMIGIPVRSDDEIEPFEGLKTASETEFIRETEVAGVISGSSENPENSEVLGALEEIESPEMKIIEPDIIESDIIESDIIEPESSEPSAVILKNSGAVSELASGSEFQPVSELSSESISASLSELSFESVSGSVSEFAPAPVSKSAFPLEYSEFPEENPESEIEISKEGEKEPEKKVGNLPESGDELGIEISLEKEGARGKNTNDLPEEKPLKVPEEKPEKVSDIDGKTTNVGQKKGKGKPAVPRQYNLGDYL